MAIYSWLMSSPTWTEYLCKCTLLTLIGIVGYLLVYGIVTNIRNKRNPFA